MRAAPGRRCARTWRRPLAGALIVAALVAASPSAARTATRAAGLDVPSPAGGDAPAANGRDGDLAVALAMVAAVEAGVIAILLLALARRRRASAAAARDAVKIARLARAGAAREAGRSIAREIGTPLTSALNNLGAARRLLLRSPPPLDELGVAMDEARSAGESVAHVLQRLHALAPAGGVAEVVELHEVAREGVQLVSSVGAAAIAADLSPVPSIRGDRAELLQAVVELLLNAVEETAAAGRGRVRVRTRSENAAVELSVEYPSFVEPDRALAPLAATEKSALAAELAVAGSIVASHGGTISTELPSHGARFSPSRLVTLRVRFASAPSNGGA